METFKQLHHSGGPVIRFDPTYKGWKPVITPYIGTKSITALILPTRDGNDFFKDVDLGDIDRFDPTYKGWKRD